MKRIIIALSMMLVSPLVFGAETSSAETPEMIAAREKASKIAAVQQELEKSWAGATDIDNSHLALYMKLAKELLSSDHAEIKAKIEKYKAMLSVSNNDKVLMIVFLLRRKAHQESFYNAIDKWSALSVETQAKISANLHATYTVVAEGSIEENQKLVALLGKRETKVKSVLAKLPDAFKEITSALDEQETTRYLEVLHDVIVNTVAVRTLLTQVGIV